MNTVLRLTSSELEELHTLLHGIADASVCLQMKQYIQHGSISTYEHCRAVTEACFLFNRRLHLGADEQALVRGAFLHDLYLYDWHDPDNSHKWHGFHHADRALANASMHFPLTETEKNMIYSHMWPLNLTRFPETREALILCLCDKYCALTETLLHR